MCHGTYLSQIHVFGFGAICVILIGFCLLLSPFLCVLHFNVVLFRNTKDCLIPDIDYLNRLRHNFFGILYPKFASTWYLLGFITILICV